MKNEILKSKSMNGIYYVKVKLEVKSSIIIDEDSTSISDDSYIQQISVEELMDNLVKRGLSEEELIEIYYGILKMIRMQIKYDLQEAGIDPDNFKSLEK